MLRRRETRAEDEAQHIMFAHLREFGFGRKTLGQYLGANLIHRQAPAIITDFDDDMPALMIRIQQNAPGFRLACRATISGLFQPMIPAIAHHMRERILDQFQYLAVQFGIGAAHLKINFLAQFIGQIAHQPRQLRPGIANRLHTRLHHAFLQFGSDVRQPLQGHRNLAIG